MAVTLYENLRTPANSPFYLADLSGGWARAGVAVEGLVAGRAAVSWGGPMRLLLDNDRDPDCPLVAFGQVVARDPFLLVGRVRADPAGLTTEIDAKADR